MIKLASPKYISPTFTYSQQSGSGSQYVMLTNPFNALVSSVELLLVDISVNSGPADPGHRWRANPYTGMHVGGNYYGYTWSCSRAEIELRIYRQSNVSASADAYCIVTL